MPSTTVGQGALTDDWVSAAANRDSKYFSAELQTIRKRMSVGLVNRCYGHLNDRPALEACFRDALADTFDDSGQGRRNCAAVTDLDQYTDCIIVGSSGLDALHRLDPEAKVGPEVWTGRKALGEAVQKAVVISAIQNCSDARDDAAAIDCAYDWLRKRLAIPDQLVNKCPVDLPDNERGQCLGQAASIDFVQRHLPKLLETGA